MQYKIITMLLLAAALGTVQSCEDAFSKDVIINVPRQPDRLVIVSNSAVGERFSAYITRSVDVLAPTNFSPVSSAAVALFQGGTFLDSLVYNSTRRLFIAKNNTQPVPGVTYTLRASLAGLAMAEGTIQVPLAVPIQSLTYRPRFRTSPGGETRDEIRFSFQDLPAEGNHYLVRVLIPAPVSSGVPPYNPLFCLHTVDPDAETSSGGLTVSYDDCIEEGFIMKDTRFNGRLKEVVLQVNSFEMGAVTSGGVTYRPLLELQAITPEYYRYFKSQKLYADTQGNPFTEPITVYTNIRDGYGIFTAHNRAVRTVQ